MTESDAVSVRIYRNSKPGQHAFQADHDMRVRKVPAYVDRDRIHDNSVIIPTISEDDARALCQEKRAKRETKRAMKKGTTVTVAGIITFGKEAQKIIRSLDRETQDAAYLEIAKACAGFLKTTLVGVSAHRDEYAPHAHFTILAYNDDGFPLSETVKKRHTSKLQDIAANVLQEQFGLDIKRGKALGQRIADGEDWSKTHHRTVKQLQQDAPRELAEIAAERDKARAERDEARADRDQFRLERDEARAERDEALARLELTFDDQDAADSVLKEIIEKVKHYNDLIEKAKAQLKHQETLSEQKINKLEKRVNVYENRLNNLVKDVATMENLDIKDIRESLEKTGHLSPAVVMPFDEDDHEETKVNKEREALSFVDSLRDEL